MDPDIFRLCTVVAYPNHLNKGSGGLSRLRFLKCCSVPVRQLRIPFSDKKKSLANYAAESTKRSEKALGPFLELVLFEVDPK